MPELPEVETIKRDLEQLIVGKKILSLETNSAKQVLPSPEKVKKEVAGTKIEKIGRRAKILQIFLDNKKVLAIHLKMTGRLLVRKKTDPPDEWQRTTLSLSNNLELRFADLRKFGWIKLLEGEEDLKKISAELGPEPLVDLNLQKFQEIISYRSRPIKLILMDQKIIAGIGNIYANEALFLAKIDPRRPANKLKKKEMKTLFSAIEKVLRAGLENRGASDNHYRDALGRKGSYQKHFLIYGKKDESCLNCQGKIKRIILGGRGTFFCPKCQK